MAYNEQLAERITEVLADRDGITSRKMFGGIAFMVDGNMCCGVVGDDLMVRVGPDAYPRAISMRGARPMDFTGRPSKGMVYVGAGALASQGELVDWVRRGLDYATSLPPK